jgi:hypothetical protein
MHELDSQERLISNLEIQEVEDPLVFKPLQYEMQEWENIPTVVPRFVIYLSKYINGISNFCNDLRTMETTEALGVKIEEHVEVSCFERLNYLDVES